MTEENEVQTVQEEREETDIQPYPMYPPISFAEKMNYLQKLVEAEDWSDDKAYTMGSTVVPYLSADKVFRQFGPIFRKAGLVFVPRFHDAVKLDPIDKRPNHWAVQLEADVFDPDNNIKLTYNAYGEGADNQDKGLIIAQTVARRALLAAMGFLVDGINEGDSDNNGAAFRKSPAEQNEIRGNILKKGIPKIEDKPAVPKAPVAAPKAPVAPAPKAPAAPKVEEPKEEESGFKLSKVQEDSINNVASMWDDKLAKGEVTQERYDQMQAAKTSISSMKDVMMFSKVYGKVE